MYEPISSTAHIIAHIRSFTNIPYAGTIATLCQARKKTAAFHHRPDFDIDLDAMQVLAPWIGLRLRSLHREAGINGRSKGDFVELASGLSPGGMIATDNTEVRYLETDLPDMIAQKKRIAGQLVGPRTNFGFAAVSALDGDALERAVDAAFPERNELTILNEGLLQYLSHDEVLVVARNAHRLLTKRGGRWLTPDIVYKSEILRGYEKSEKSRRIRQAMLENTGRDMVECAFVNDTEAQKLLESAGFSIRRHWQKGADGQRTSHLDRQQVWTMTPK